MNADRILRDHLASLLDGKQAHLNFEDVLQRVPFHLQGERSTGSPHTLWQLLEHLRIAQWDILEFSRNPDHVSPEFPSGYWPEAVSPPDEGAWERSLAALRADLKAMQELVRDETTDLYRPIPHGSGQTILREALLVADHNAYHLGQMVLLKRLLGLTPVQRTGLGT